MRSVLIIFFPVVLILSSLFFHLNYPPVHDHQFEGRQVITQDSEMIFDFIQGGETLPEKLSGRELAHLKDVKRLVTIAKLILAFSVILTAISMFQKKVSIQLKRGGWLTVLLGVIGSMFALSFEYVFHGFHKLLFVSESWIFNRTDWLIILYPQDFFFTFFVSIVLNTVILGFVAIFIGVLLRRHPYYLLQ